MGPYLRLALYAAGAVVSPLIVLVAVVFAISVIRTVRFKRQRGWLAGQVPHTLLYEFYHSCSIDMDSQKVLCCLAEKGVEFKEREIDIGVFGRFENLEDAMLRVNPNGSQPTLVHDGHPVVGIEEIITYLEEHVEGPPLLPPSAEERQEVIRWIHVCSHSPVPNLVDEKGKPQWTFGMATRLLSIPVMSSVAAPTTFCAALSAVWRHPNPLPEFGMLTNSLTRHFRKKATVPPRNASRLSFAVLSRSFDEIEKELTGDGRAFLVGGRFSLADVCLVANLSRLELLGLLELLLSSTHPRTREYYERMKKRESCRVAFRPRPSFPGLEELDRSFARFRKQVADHGLVTAFRLDEDGEEEEED